MKAAIITTYQAPIEIGTVDRPVLKADSVIVAVHAASINPIDDILRSGTMKDTAPLTFPHVMGYDVSGVVVEVGSDTMKRSFKVLKKGGTMISIKGQDTETVAMQYGVRFEGFYMEPNGAMLGELGALIDAGAVKPVIGSTFPMEQSAAAYDHLANGHSVGKIAVVII